MSTITVRPCKDAAGAVGYVLYGHDPQRRKRLLADRATRAASFTLSMADGGTTPAQFVKRAELVSGAHGRKNMLYSYVLAFHPDEFDVTRQEDLDRVRDVAVELAERMHSADYLVAVHSDSVGGHAHAHVLVMNHDNLTGKSLQRCTSWTHGLRQVNDELMCDKGLRVLPDPTEPRPDWELRRESFAPGGFEQTLGDKVYTVLADPRCVDRTAFEQLLAQEGIRLAVTRRDGWSYKMRRDDNGKPGRKKASTLTPEFTAEGAQKIFDYHAQKGHDHGTPERYAGAGPAKPDYGDVGAVDLDAARHRAASIKAHEGHRRPDVVREGHGRGGLREAGAPVELAAARAALDAAARRRDQEKAERDREDARRRRRAAQRQRGREASRRAESVSQRARRLCAHQADQRESRSDDYEL